MEAGKSPKQRNVFKIWMSQTHLDLTIWYSYLTQSNESDQSAEMFIRLANDKVSWCKRRVPLNGKSRPQAEIPVAENKAGK